MYVNCNRRKVAITNKSLYRGQIALLSQENCETMLYMTRPLNTSKRMLLVTPMSLSQHTKYKFRAKMEGRPMAQITRELIDQYLGTPEPEPDFYDVLSENIQEALQS